MMIAIDTSSLVAFFADAGGRDVELVENAFAQHCAVFPPVVVSEMLSDHKLSPEIVRLLTQVPMLPVLAGYWERAGLARSRVLKRGFKARLADTLIAQSCLDHEIALITRDLDFTHFAKLCGLQLLR
jgi:predicted nucleic acid-binding protein